MKIYVEATTLIALSSVSNLDRLCDFDGDIVVLPAVEKEIATEPAKSKLRWFLERNNIQNHSPASETDRERALSVLDELEQNGDVHLLACVLHHTDSNEPVSIISDDQRVRTVTRGFGATVTGTIGVLVHAVEEGFDSQDAKTLLRRIDGNGLHMTGELREKAIHLIDNAVDQSE